MAIAVLVWAPRMWKSCALVGLLFWQIPETKPAAYLSTLKGDAVWVEMAGRHSIASLPTSVEPAWIQSHLSPLWSNEGVKDTLTRRWPLEGNVQWIYHGKHFAYIRQPTECRGQQTLVIGKEIKYKNPVWLKSWRGATWYFLKKPSDYWMGVLKPYLPMHYYFLDERQAIEL